MVMMERKSEEKGWDRVKNEINQNNLLHYVIKRAHLIEF